MTLGEAHRKMACQPKLVQRRNPAAPPSALWRATDPARGRAAARNRQDAGGPRRSRSNVLPRTCVQVSRRQPHSETSRLSPGRPPCLARSRANSPSVQSRAPHPRARNRAERSGPSLTRWWAPSRSIEPRTGSLRDGPGRSDLHAPATTPYVVTQMDDLVERDLVIYPRVSRP